MVESRIVLIEKPSGMGNLLKPAKIVFSIKIEELKKQRERDDEVPLIYPIDN